MTFGAQLVTGPQTGVLCHLSYRASCPDRIRTGDPPRPEGRIRTAQIPRPARHYGATPPVPPGTGPGGVFWDTWPPSALQERPVCSMASQSIARRGGYEPHRPEKRSSARLPAQGLARHKPAAAPVLLGFSGAEETPACLLALRSRPTYVLSCGPTNLYRRRWAGALCGVWMQRGDQRKPTPAPVGTERRSAVPPPRRAGAFCDKLPEGRKPRCAHVRGIEPPSARVAASPLPLRYTWCPVAVPALRRIIPLRAAIR
jgi:hypothetical protein